MYTGLRLDYRIRLWAPTSAISVVAELLVFKLVFNARSSFLFHAKPTGTLKEFFRTAQPNPFLFPLLFPSVSPSSTFPPHPAKWPLKSSGIGGGAPTTNAVWHTSSSENVSSDIICVFMLSCIGQYHIMCNPHYGND